MIRALILSEIEYKAIRSSGAGGQHVNKVSSKVILTFDLQNSHGLTENEKAILFEKLGPRLTKAGVLQLSADLSRSQSKNKSLVTARLFEILAKNLIRPIKRKPTKPTKGSIQRKLKNKLKDSEKKQLRRKPSED